MTKVQVCSRCGTMFAQGDAHCGRCGADRSVAAEDREMRELCSTYMGEAPVSDEVGREVRPIFEPKWGSPQWYEFKDGRPRRRWRRGQGPGGDGSGDARDEGD